MDTAFQVLVSGLTLGAMYAISTVSLSLIWGALNVLNMAQGALLTFGGYMTYVAFTGIGFGVPLSILFSVVAGGMFGLFIYIAVVRQMLNREGFEVNVIIATVGIGTVLEALLQKFFGAYPIRQPLTVEGGFLFSNTYVPYNSVIIVLGSAILMIMLSILLARTRMGRAMRAVSQSRDAARLMGVPVNLVYAQVFALAGALSAASGIMLSTITTLAPTMGYDPMLKAFIICVVAGLGNVMGALFAAFMLGLFEAFIQYAFGVRFAFAGMLLVVIIVLVWKPNGLFSRTLVNRL